MLTNLKALVVILAIGWAAFAFARPVCLNFMTKEAFARRRNVWFALTIVAFVSPSFWIYAIVALVVLAWAAARDENPLAVFAITLFVIPNVSFYIPTVLVNNLFDLTQFRILSLAILIPAMFRPQFGSHLPQSRFRREDAVLAAFLLLQVVLTMPYQSETATMRKTVLLFIDIFVLFYLFSRLGTRERLTDVLASFWIGFAVMAPIAIFESLKGWLLYTGIGGVWGDPNVYSWLFRGESLRAQAAANHSINLGFHVSLALGFYLFLRTRGVDRFRDLTILATLVGGLVVTYSRGAWIMGICMGVLFMPASRPDAAKRLAGALVALTVMFALIYVSPLKESVLDRLPRSSAPPTRMYDRIPPRAAGGGVVDLDPAAPILRRSVCGVAHGDPLRGGARHHRHRQRLSVHRALPGPGGFGRSWSDSRYSHCLAASPPAAVQRRSGRRDDWRGAAGMHGRRAPLRCHRGLATRRSTSCLDSPSRMPWLADIKSAQPEMVRAVGGRRVMSSRTL